MQFRLDLATIDNLELWNREEHFYEPNRNVFRPNVDVEAILAGRQNVREQIFVIRHADERHISRQWTSPLEIRSVLIDLRHKHVQQMKRTVGVLKIAVILLEIDQKLSVDDGGAIIECDMDRHIVGRLHQIASDAEQTFVSRDKFHIANAFIAVPLIGGALYVLDILLVGLQNKFRNYVGGIK